MKTAIVLMNLGGPLAREDIPPFLFNFFMDKNIIAAPLPIRFLLAKYISWSRSRGAADSSYKALGYKSPLLENTQAQADALQKILGNACKVFISMRYWHPLAPETAKQVAAYQPDKIILLPLYPQFSTTTVKSSFESWDSAAQNIGLNVPTYRLCCYPKNDGFIAASAALIAAALKQAPSGTRLLFSAHGLPEKIIRDGDPYQWQCEQTARAIVDRLALPGLDWEICYQSRVGPLKWIGPSTDAALEKAAREGKNVLVYPHAFVSEHVETLVEIEEEYREKAQHLGIAWFGRVPTVSIHADFIKGLAQEVQALENRQGACQRICPAPFKCCPCKKE